MGIPGKDIKIRHIRAAARRSACIIKTLLICHNEKNVFHAAPFRL
jgi:hypothetical protein